jgi:hypothetical protein
MTPWNRENVRNFSKTRIPKRRKMSRIIRILTQEAGYFFFFPLVLSYPQRLQE